MVNKSKLFGPKQAKWFKASVKESDEIIEPFHTHKNSNREKSSQVTRNKQVLRQITVPIKSCTIMKKLSILVESTYTECKMLSFTFF